jgi:deoxyribodipyrimidine photolyase
MVAAEEINQMEQKLAKLQKTFTETCEYYLIEKGDEKAQSSQEFFKFFTQFVDQVVKSMPKEEKKKPNPTATTGVKKFNMGK